jgi:hypothetical protein
MTTKQPQALVSAMLGLLAMFSSVAFAEDPPKKPAPPKSATVKPPVVAPEDFSAVMTRMQAAKTDLVAFLRVL